MPELGILSHLTRTNEPYMNADQLNYFRDKLLCWRNELTATLRERVQRIQAEDARPIEDMERCVRAFDKEMEISNQARTRQLILMIDEALDRIETGTYGYCVETEEPIGLERLEASPFAAHCLIVQERLEKQSQKRLHLFL